MAEQTQTTDHKTIQSFADEHNLKPAKVEGTGNGNTGMIRLMQPGSSASETDNLEEISWNNWFKAFEDNDLALVYEKNGSGNFNKLVSRN